MLSQKLNMDEEAAEKWIVNLIRNARLNAKIDSQVGVPCVSSLSPGKVRCQVGCLTFLVRRIGGRGGSGKFRRRIGARAKVDHVLDIVWLQETGRCATSKCVCISVTNALQLCSASAKRAEPVWQWQLHRET